MEREKAEKEARERELKKQNDEKLKSQSGGETEKPKVQSEGAGTSRTPEQIKAEAERANQADAEDWVDLHMNLVSAQNMLRERAKENVRKRMEDDKRAMVQFKADDAFSRPKIHDLAAFSYEPVSPDIATMEQIEIIQGGCLDAGVPRDGVTFSLWDIARYCADAGSSEFTEFIGRSTHSGDVTRAEIAAIIKKTCLLRRFCGFYAKIVWNIMLRTNTPPSGWIKKGYKENTKFAAFDFFTSVTSHCALEPDNGLIRKPFHEEIVAHQTNKGVNLHRVEAQKDKSASSLHEVTGGRSGPRARLTLKGKEF